ncbi:Phosphoglycolate phosphatase [Agrobacterium sp. DSM 25558]|uniref:HAD family hydrolase n=1 Tax=Agrobacterium sp. DSM 25558 TaxID=1907665 RepID=UPI0009724F2C|nr:HAD family hydrolase [Agrobacterium sp. DSM 25558]SCX28483.1 Phosphoglycolate phosphatase [Agrobacterium sp. DSM 25558]
MKNQLLIFDLDGTLFDTPSAIVEVFSGVFSLTDVPVPPPESIRSTIGLPLPAAFALLTGESEDSEQVTDCVSRYLAHFRTLILPKAVDLLYPGVADGLGLLRTNKITLAVATNKFQASAEAILGASAILPFFAVVLGADQVDNPKPHPEAVERILQQTGADRESTLMIGDTTHDVQMANAAGIRSIGVTYGVHNHQQIMAAKPTHLAASFQDVLSIIAENTWKGKAYA